VVPAVYTKPISMHISHPDPSSYQKQLTMQHTFCKDFSSSFTLLHPIATRRCFQFPETRLIQYDCGKLIIRNRWSSYLLWLIIRQVTDIGHSVEATQTRRPQVSVHISCLQLLMCLLSYPRVLIFTQMARMLDVLEIFLNYHGHTYLRLDGATPVQKRQVYTPRLHLPHFVSYLCSSWWTDLIVMRDCFVSSCPHVVVV